MKNPQHTIRRSNNIVYRRRLPSDVVSPASGQFFQVSLKTGDARQALRRINDWNLPKQFQDQVDMLRGLSTSGNNKAADGRQLATSAEAMDAVKASFAPVFRDLENNLIENNVSLDHPLVRKGLSSDRYPEATAILGPLKSLYEDSQRRQTFLEQNAQLLDDLSCPDLLVASDSDLALASIILAKAGLDIQPGSAAHMAAAKVAGRGRYQVERLYFARQRSDYNVKLSDPLFTDFVAPSEAAPKPKAADSNAHSISRLDQLIAEYRAKKQPGWPQGTLDDFDYTMKLATGFFGATCPLDKITVRTCLEFRALLAQLPANHGKKKLFQTLSLHDAAALARKMGIAGRAPQTLKKQLGELCRLFEHAERFNYIGASPARGLAEDIVDEVDARDKREALPDSDIQKILQSDVITGVARHGLPVDWSRISFKAANEYWLLMILITTGMRLSEACQLHVGDVKISADDVVYFSLMPEPSAKGIDQKRFKTKISRRMVPVSPDLINLGLLDWQKHQQQQGVRLLLGHFMPNNKGKNDAASKFIKRLFASLNLSVANASAHHLRHTMKDRLQNTGVDHKTLCDYGGWSINSNVVHRYGNRSTVSQLVDKLSGANMLPRS